MEEKFAYPRQVANDLCLNITWAGCVRTPAGWGAGCETWTSRSTEGYPRKPMLDFAKAESSKQEVGHAKRSVEALSIYLIGIFFNTVESIALSMSLVF